ncbi:MAG: N-acetylmuramic acid 6-phosphate etherase [Thermoproteota archaeon]|nr:N-acetylmuramic acid 6-phosphate etherase [Candidatus Brockarchaeota archaeon]MBO3767741.1 N-acetylmuramic acid 6-phosphate etherase [Candidatus Brockarchaeota archaeon]MBO3801349.1 N-acetylmuramic acid 6-phosphate etherase [Candidatus Brockarchaeota archaeon]
MFDELLELTTESRNLRSMNIDRVSIEEILKIINEEDKLVPLAVEKEIPNIAKAVRFVIDSFKKNGRLIYVGTGTSGRLGVLDAAECPPTFGVSSDMVVGIIAGFPEALWKAVEGAEDSTEDGMRAMEKISVNERDTVVGISASGRTPFVIGALIKAKERGARTVGISTNKNPKIANYVEVMITPLVGPEVITGSTRMKSGTAQKLVLNMISTASMIGIGKVYQNLMIDLKPLNNKLIERAKRIIMELTGVNYEKASEIFLKSGMNVKISLVMALGNVEAEEAKKFLELSEGHVFKAVEISKTQKK